MEATKGTQAMPSRSTQPLSNNEALLCATHYTRGPTDSYQATSSPDSLSPPLVSPS